MKEKEGGERREVGNPAASVQGGGMCIRLRVDVRLNYEFVRAETFTFCKYVEMSCEDFGGKGRGRVEKKEKGDRKYR